MCATQVSEELRCRVLLYFLSTSKWNHNIDYANSYRLTPSIDKLGQGGQAGQAGIFSLEKSTGSTVTGPKGAVFEAI